MTIDQLINVLGTVTLIEMMVTITPPCPETVHRLRARIDEAFGRKSGELSRPEGVP